MQKNRICDFNLENQIVLIRADLNVPLDPNNQTVLSLERIIASLPTIIYALKQNAKVILLSHLGRVKQESDKQKYSLKPVARELEKLLRQVYKKEQKVKFCAQNTGPTVNYQIQNLQKGEVLVLENTRFQDLNNKSESKNNTELAKEWASFCDVFVNDAFGTAHRSHASNVGIAQFTTKNCLGLLMENEILQLNKLLNNAKSPFIAIVGGAKVIDKIGILKTLLQKVDKLLLGGGMAYTFMKVLGQEVGKSLVDKEALEEAKKILDLYKEKIVLPEDFVCANSIHDLEGKVYKTIPKDLDSLDIGPQTVKNFQTFLATAKTVFWNGPLGFYENKFFAQGTHKIAKALSENQEAFVVIGGGDSAAAASIFKEKISHISTGGGASLEFLEQKVLPGIAAISQNLTSKPQDCQQEWYNLNNLIKSTSTNFVNSSNSMQEESKKKSAKTSTAKKATVRTVKEAAKVEGASDVTKETPVKANVKKVATTTKKNVSKTVKKVSSTSPTAKKSATPKKVVANKNVSSKTPEEVKPKPLSSQSTLESQEATESQSQQVNLSNTPKTQESHKSFLSRLFSFFKRK